MKRIVDLLTDADSQPPLELRQAMSDVPMGLDLVGSDTATNQLEEKTAEIHADGHRVFRGLAGL